MADRVAKTTDIPVVDRDAASEAKRRAALKVRVVSEAEWSGLVGGAG